MRKRKPCRRYTHKFAWSPAADVIFKPWLALLEPRPTHFTISLGAGMTCRCKFEIGSNTASLVRRFSAPFGYASNFKLFKSQPELYLEAIVEIARFYNEP